MGRAEWVVCEPGVSVGRILGSHKEDVWQGKDFMSKRSRKGSWVAEPVGGGLG